MSEAPTDLPRYSKDYTSEQRDACVQWLSHLALPDLRQRQSIMREQIERAYALATKPVPPPWAHDTLEDLQDKEQQLTEAVGRWLDRTGEPMTQTHDNGQLCTQEPGCPNTNDGLHAAQMTQTQATKTVTMHCTWTNEVNVEVPEDWEGDDPFQFADQVTARAVDLYDMEQA